MIPDKDSDIPSPQQSGGLEFISAPFVDTGAGWSDPLLGRLLDGKYRVESVIGKGGMGMVYKAIHETAGYPVAIKALRPQFVDDTNILQRFQREAVAASRLNHPNIVTLYDFTVTPEAKVFIVMEYLQGRSLSELIKEEHRLGTGRFVRIFSQVCEALEHAHRRGVIHRDLKPANIMLVTQQGDPDFVKVVDFGVAKLVADATESERLSRTGEVFGSPIYMSPEQCLGEKLDSRSDIYSLGVVMYEALTGQVPLLGKDILETIFKHKSEIPARPNELIAGLNLPDGLEAAVLKALSKRPSDRQQSMAELKQELESGLKESGQIRTRHRPISRNFTASDPRIGSPGSLSRGLQVQPEPQNNLIPVIIGVLLSLIILSAIAFAISSAQNSSSDKSKRSPDSQAAQRTPRRQSHIH